MARKPKQKLKLMRVRDILLENTDENHPMSVKEIISHLSDYGIEAERKSIYEDLAELEAYGMDIITVKGPSGGVFIGNRDFEIAELKVLADAVQSSRFISSAKSRILIDKLGRLTDKYSRAKLSRQVHIYDRVKTMNRTIYNTTDIIHNAISENRQIEFGYFNWNWKKEKVLRHNGKRYKVSPWLLIWNDENYYLAAYDSDAKQIRHYRVDKMEDVRLSPFFREGEDCFRESDTDMYSTGIFDMFSGEVTTVGFECREEKVGALIDRFGKDITILKNGDILTVYATVQISPRFFGWVMGFGNEIRIVSPEPVVKKMKEMIASIAGNYGINAVE